MESQATNNTVESHRTRPTGPHQGILAAVSLALTLAALIAGAALSGGGVIPGSVAPPSSAAPAFFANWPTAARVGSLLLFGAAVPLGISAAAFYARQLRLGIRVPGPVISLFGGIAGAILFMLSALTLWTAADPDVAASAPVAKALALAAWAAGSIGQATGLGLFVAGIAVPMLILRLASRPVAWAGLVIAALAELSFLAFAIDAWAVVVPIARFAALVWLVVAGFLLPTSRPRARRGADGAA